MREEAARVTVKTTAATRVAVEMMAVVETAEATTMLGDEGGSGEGGEGGGEGQPKRSQKRHASAKGTPTKRGKKATARR